MEVVTQKYFLERMGIIKRAEILEKNMTSSQKNYISSTLNRLLNKQLMGELFKVCAISPKTKLIPEGFD